MRRILCKTIFLLNSAAPAFATEAETIAAERQSMQNELKGYRQEVTSLFSSVPQSHIMPERDVVGISVSVERPDVTMVPSNKTVDKNSRKTKPRLDYAGWRATPLISFSNKRFGVGFAGEAGQLQAHYIDDTTSLYREEFGSAKFSGIGLYGYFIPELRILPNTVTPLLLIGGKTLNVVHESTGTIQSAYSVKNTTKHSYTVKKYEVGIDLGIELAKRFTVLPWTSYSIVAVGGESGSSSQTQASAASYGVVTPINTALVSDKVLFWNLSPTLNYGIDFSVGLGNLKLKFGGLLGVLGSLMKSNDQIYENTLTAGLSYDFKSH
jgi:hypothetical protein